MGGTFDPAGGALTGVWGWSGGGGGGWAKGSGGGGGTWGSVPCGGGVIPERGVWGKDGGGGGCGKGCGLPVGFDGTVGWPGEPLWGREFDLIGEYDQKVFIINHAI